MPRRSPQPLRGPHSGTWAPQPITPFEVLTERLQTQKQCANITKGLFLGGSLSFHPHNSSQITAQRDPECSPTNAGELLTAIRILTPRTLLHKVTGSPRTLGSFQQDSEPGPGLFCPWPSKSLLFSPLGKEVFQEQEGLLDWQGGNCLGRSRIIIEPHTVSTGACIYYCELTTT